MAGGFRKHLCPIWALCCVPSGTGSVWVHTHSVIIGSMSKSGVAQCVFISHLSFVGCLFTVFDSFSLACNERVFSDIPLGALSFLAVVNCGFVQTSAYSISIEQLNVGTFLNLELWSKWCNCEGEAEGTTTKETFHTFGFVAELWWLILISNFVRIKCLLSCVCMRLVLANADFCCFSPPTCWKLGQLVKELQFSFVFLRQNTSLSALMRSSRS